jgi:hypothetical protein
MQEYEIEQKEFNDFIESCHEQQDQRDFQDFMEWCEIIEKEMENEKDNENI